MERVVITGIGLVTPNGIGTAESWQSISGGQPAIATITLFDASTYRSQIAGEVKGFDPTQFIEKKKVKEMARFVQLSMAASKLAVQDGHLELTDEERERAGCFIGVGLGGLENVIEAMTRTLDAKGPDKISPYFIPSASSRTSRRGRSRWRSASGGRATATPAPARRRRTPSARRSSGFDEVEPTSWWRAAPNRPSPGSASAASARCSPSRAATTTRPAPAARSTRGATASSSAKARGRSFSNRSRAPSARREDLRRGHRLRRDERRLPPHAARARKAGAQRAMRMALKDAKLDPDATSTTSTRTAPRRQRATSRSRAPSSTSSATTRRSKKLWVSSTKSMMGHLLGGAGAVEAAISALAIARGVIPPTINLEEQDPECRLDYVPKVARERRIEHAMSNSFGFGGTNCSLVFSDEHRRVSK